METIQLKKKFAATGDFIYFMLRYFREVLKPPYEWRELLIQCYKTGYKTLPLVAITALLFLSSKKEQSFL